MAFEQAGGQVRAEKFSENVPFLGQEPRAASACWTRRPPEGRCRPGRWAAGFSGLLRLLAAAAMTIGPLPGFARGVQLFVRACDACAWCVWDVKIVRKCCLMWGRFSN